MENSAIVATGLIHRRRLLTLLCGHLEISSFLFALDSILVEYPVNNDTLAILALVFVLEFHATRPEWCLFHTHSYQADLYWYFSDPSQHRLIRLYLEALSRWPDS